jgi:hypothetical protein
MSKITKAGATIDAPALEEPYRVPVGQRTPADPVAAREAGLEELPPEDDENAGAETTEDDGDLTEDDERSGDEELDVDPEAQTGTDDPPAPQYDPADHTVAEVNDYLSTHADDPTEVDRVLNAERAGRARVGILND